MKTKTVTNVWGYVSLALIGIVTGLSLAIVSGKDDNRSLILFGGVCGAASVMGLPFPGKIQVAATEEETGEAG